MMLHVEHVKKAFGETDVLRDVSLSVNRRGGDSRPKRIGQDDAAPLSEFP